MLSHTRGITLSQKFFYGVQKMEVAKVSVIRGHDFAGNAQWEILNLI
jgi:hypothetical protein